MYNLDLNQMSKNEFLTTYWQKKPVVIRQGFKDFVDPIAADEFAGIAMEEMVQSRLISKKNGEWQAEFGPFESYEHLGERDWSLVIQALDNFSEEAAELIEPFRFLPHWRLDDLMASFATEGGSVGPHVDNYDTFICQGSGKRHWRVGDNGRHSEVIAHEALLHVEPFEAIIDVELEAGDILYIPPGFPHEGVALEPSMSFSIGFRANSAISLLSGFADHLIDNELGGQLLQDPQRKAITNSGEITNSDYANIKQQLQNLLDDDKLFKNFVGNFLTNAKHELDLMPSDEPFEAAEVSELLAIHAIKRLGGLRAFYFEDTLNDGVFYLNGEQINFNSEIAPVIKLLCNQVVVTPSELAPWSTNEHFVTLMVGLLDQGYWFWTEAE
ncbi:cupin domain-containing protein [Colwellia sp. 1_MG-2023]|uniref:ribosomal protein uL16 3-hydroxylase n=1 Tax=unclassified Colwellia TaxID=196834 RepID=UPI001C080E30|nr:MULTISPECIES: cupin domain-containing protein [unclassified Colwellia]MBU2925745.1 cupin domain-containing protein [Colwellia sp. C2M11]MDO6651029.1 cupin domain-containing protein [Colwellia sp. 3_MG-2023]MDO6664064.1 cupin domain-containing protein [Colwellia sp. 2_MG-2023]MDO6688415.1 cupin domain-containing protein [Colwellia sp. 1_MG-2023]